jgi:hypothetical protein
MQNRATTTKALKIFACVTLVGVCVGAVIRIVSEKKKSQRVLRPGEANQSPAS